MSAKTEIEQKTEEEIRATLAPRLAAAKTRQEKTRETAAVLFFGYGIYPSAKTVYGYTHHGSMTDIGGDLRGFWNELREKSRVKIEVPMLPAPVADLFSEALAKVWELAMDKAHAALDGERQEVAEQVAKAQREAQEADRMRRIAESAAEESKIELRQERGNRETAEKRVEALVAQIDVLQSSLVKWQAQTEAEARARQDAEERFSSDLKAERNIRKRETEMFEGDIQFCKMQIETARIAEQEMRNQLKEEKVSKELDLTSYRQRANRAEEALGAVHMELAQLKGKNAGLEAYIAELQERMKNMTARTGKVSAKSANIKRLSLRK